MYISKMMIFSSLVDRSLCHQDRLGPDSSFIRPHNRLILTLGITCTRRRTLTSRYRARMRGMFPAPRLVPCCMSVSEICGALNTWLGYRIMLTYTSTCIKFTTILNKATTIIYFSLFSDVWCGNHVHHHVIIHIPAYVQWDHVITLLGCCRCVAQIYPDVCISSNLPSHDSHTRIHPLMI